MGSNMDQHQPNQHHILQPQNLPQTETAGLTVFQHSHYQPLQPQNSQSLPQQFDQYGTTAIRSIPHHHPQKSPQLFQTDPTQQFSYQHQLSFSLNQQQQSLQNRRNHPTQSIQQTDYQTLPQQLPQTRAIQLPKSQRLQHDPLIYSENQAPIFQTQSINFQGQQRQHPTPHALSAEFTRPLEYSRPVPLNEFEKHYHDTLLAVEELLDEKRTRETEITFLHQKYDALEKVHNNRLSVEKFLRCELQKQNPKAADMVSKITSLKFELDISKKIALSLRAQNEILSNANENLNKQVQTLQTETQHQNTKIGTLAEENLGIKKSLALSNQEVDSIQQQNRANEQLIKILGIENIELPVLKEKMESLTNLQKKMNDDKEELDKEVEGYKKEKTSLSYELEKVKNQSRLDLKMEEQKVEKALNDFNDWKAKFELEVLKLTNENQCLKEKVEESENLQKILQNRDNELNNLRNKTKYLQSRLSAYENGSQYKKLMESNQDREQELAAANATIQKMLKETVEKDSIYALEIKNMANELEAKKADLEAEQLDQLKTQLNHTSKRNNELRIELESVTKARTQLSLEVIVLNNTVKLHESTIEKQKKELRGSRNLLKDTQHEIENQMVEMHNQKRSVKSHRATISKLEKVAAENVKKLTFYRFKEKKWMADNSKLRKELTTEKERTKDGLDGRMDKGRTLKRQFCSEEADRNINLVECQRQQETQPSRESTNKEKSEDLLTLEDTAEKNNPIDCKYPPSKRICVDEGNISRDLDETNGLE
ncbi:unnamed protein product [Orchesella dallaii]|uniref:Uncharacterized protein n=1 Tax=Orchesella dallaii TaxID=48710 RepID=A0ABP1RNY3_9HEXA